MKTELLRSFCEILQISIVEWKLSIKCSHSVYWSYSTSGHQLYEVLLSFTVVGQPAEVAAQNGNEICIWIVNGLHWGEGARLKMINRNSKQKSVKVLWSSLSVSQNCFIWYSKQNNKRIQRLSELFSGNTEAWINCRKETDQQLTW